MWIFCGGMNRSGSTLQFQLTARLVEHAGRGGAIRWEASDDFPRLQKRYAAESGWKVYKTHLCTPEMRAEFEAGNARGVYVFRDVRDVMVSWVDLTGLSFERIWRKKLDSVLANFQQWTSLDNVLVSRYEELVADVPAEVRRIAEHLDIPLSIVESEQIAADYTPARQIERIRQATESGRFERSPKVGFDPVSNLHANHIRSGRSGRWSTAFSRRQVALIEGRAEQWLIANGYGVTVPRWQRTGLKIARMLGKQPQKIMGGRPEGKQK